jgi:nucleoside-diphosphate-sugar epimerase
MADGTEAVMNIALTGATGFLGRYLVRQLTQAGHHLRCWFRPKSDRAGFDAAKDFLEWLPGQLNDPEATAALVKGVDAVVHAGLARGGPGRFRASDPATMLPLMDANLMGTLRLMHAARSQPQVPRFIFISTCAVHEVILPDRALDEAHPLWPTSHYGAHKAALEKFVHSYGLGENWPICAVRPTGIYGLDHPPAKSKWFNLIGQVLRGESVSTAAGGKEVHAQDVARAVALLLTADAKAIAGQAFNCYDRYIAEQDVARIAKELTGSRSAIAHLNLGPKHQIETKKLRSLGLAFGGEALLRQTVSELVAAHQK